MDGKYYAEEGFRQEPVAIVGIGCRFSEQSDTPSALWDLLRKNDSGFGNFPADRFHTDSFFHPDQRRPGSLSVRGGYFIKDVRSFDPGFFGIRADQATAMDPLQRKLLETAFEAIESSGRSLGQISRSSCGVYVANFTTDWSDILAKDAEYLIEDHVLASQPSILSNRLSHCFDLTGPSVTINTACSGSLYALHIACNALQTGECDSALVGGASLTFSPDMTMLLSQAGMLSSSSRCKTFDDSADGYARGDGVAVLYLKKLSAALRDNDPVRGIIRGTAVTANGKTAGISQPSQEGQKEAILSAYTRAGLDMGETIYVECHGTGTSVGDPIEVAAIAEVFKREPGNEILVGSIKTNIGHTEAASGIAGVIKAVLALENSLIPATLGLKKLNTNINWRNGVKVVGENTLIPKSGIRRASVNSFGYGGSNAHCIVEATDSMLPGYKLSQEWITRWFQPARYKASLTNGHSLAEERMRFLMVVSGNDEAAIDGNIESLIDSLDDYNLQDLSYTLGALRTDLPYRSFAVANSEYPIASLSGSSAFATKSRKPRDSPRVAFVFTGQGAQWPQMGGALLQEFPSFRYTIRRLDAALGHVFTGNDKPSWTLEAALSSTTHVDIDQPSVAQPLCTAVQIAIVDLLDSWDIRPAVTVGHSSGEIAAAYASGRLTDMEAIVLAYARGISAAKAPKGAMLAVGLDAEEARVRLGSYTFHGDPPTIACINSPENVTLSGHWSALAMVEYYLKTEAVFTRKLKVSKAYHSTLMYPVGELYEHKSASALKALENTPSFRQQRSYPKISMVSTVTAKAVEGNLDVSYWRQNLESQVLFRDAIAGLVMNQDLNIDKLVEVGPHSALASPIRQTLAKFSEKRVDYLPSLVRRENPAESMLTLAGRLYISGYPANLKRINSTSIPLGPKTNPTIEETYGRLIVDFPKYKYNYSTLYWTENRPSREWRFRQHGRHDVLGSRLPGASGSTYIWRNFLRGKDLPWLKDHKVAGKVVFPAAGYIAMAVEAATQLIEDSHRDSGSGGSPLPFVHSTYEIRNLNIHAALNIDDVRGTDIVTEMKALEWTKRARSSTAFEFTIVSLLGKDIWIDNASGIVQFCKRVPTSQVSALLENTCSTRKINSTRFYNTLKSLGLEYGPSFAGLENIRSNARGNLAIGETSLAPTQGLMLDESRYFLHPATIDNCLQLAFGAIGADDMSLVKQGYVPVFAEKIVLSTPPSVHNSTQATAVTRALVTGLRSVRAESTLHDGNGSQLLDIQNLRLLSIGAQMLKHSDREPYYRVEWRPDINHLTQDAVQRVYSCTENSGTVRRRFTLLDRLTVLCMAEATHSLPHLFTDNYIPAQPHLRSFHNWIKNCLKDARAGRLDIGIIKGIFCFTPVERVQEIQNIADELRLSDDVEGALVQRVHTHLQGILEEILLSIDLLVQDGLWSKFQKEGLTYKAAYTQFKHIIELMAHNTPDMEILEVGAGTGAGTQVALDALKARGQFPRYKSYTFTDISYSFLEKAKEEFQSCAGMNYQFLNLDEGPAEQGFQNGRYDLVIAVIHATRSLRGSLEKVRCLLKPTGRLVLLETTSRGQLYGGFILGGLPGWWMGEAEGRTSTAVVDKQQWLTSLQQAGFARDVLVFDDYPAPYDTTCTFLACPAPYLTNGTNGKHAATTQSDVTVLCRDTICEHAKELEGAAAQEGWNVKLGLLRDFFISSVSTNVILLDTGRPLLEDPEEKELKTLQAVLKNGNCVLWITGGRLSQPVYGANIGLARVVRTELTSLILHTLDIDISSGKDPEEVAKLVWGYFVPMQHKEKRATAISSSFDRLESDGIIYFDRVVPDDVLNSQFSGKDEQFTEIMFQSRPSLKINISQVGQLDTLYFEDDGQTMKPLLPGYVEIKVHTAGVNWKDLINLMGHLDQNNFSSEALGIVTRTGPGVQRVQSGDSVLCIGNGNFGTHMYAHQNGCVKIGATDNSEGMATMPVVFCTALYALVTLGRLQEGETVLIHSAAGGVGLAAIQISRMVGAIPYVTVGSDMKREFLHREYDIPLNHIFHSRDTSFFADIIKVTRGRGVDVVLNTTANELLHSSLDCLATFGRHIEIGLRDILDNGNLQMGSLGRSRTFSSFLLSDMFGERRLASLLDELIELHRRGVIRPINPAKVYDISGIGSALMQLNSPEHVGKIVISYTAKESMVKYRPNPKILRLKEDAVYLLVGCLGGVGRSVALRMLDRGARHFVFLSRTGAEKPEALGLVEELKEHGATVDVVQGDVSERGDVDKAIRTARLPIRGVINAAMVLQDSYFETMDIQHLQYPLKPKIQGTLNLHNSLLVHKQHLDFFVMTSSISGVVAIPGQANYAAANTFLDCFSTYRHSLGLPASSLNLGATTEVGFVHENPQIAQGLWSIGLYGIDEEEMLKAFEVALASSSPLLRERHVISSGQLTLGLEPLKLQEHAQSHNSYTPEHIPFLSADPRMAFLENSLGARSAETNGVQLRKENTTRLSSLININDQTDSLEIVKRAFLEKISSFLSLPVEHIDDAQPIASYGMDSMLASGFRSWIFTELDADISLLEFLSSTCTVQSLSTRALQLYQENLLEGDGTDNT